MYERRFLRGRPKAEKIAIVLLATGNECVEYVGPLIKSIKEFMPPTQVFLFTDSDKTFNAIKIYHPQTGWPSITLMRYHAILKQTTVLSQYDYILYLDTDMLVCSELGISELFSEGITAVVHPCYPNTFEYRKESTAYVSGEHTYFQGCLVGGPSNVFLKMCSVIAHNIDLDLEKGITAWWFDESHLNRYLVDNPPTTILSPAYAFPKIECLVSTEKWLKESLDNFRPKIRHLDKSWKK